MKSKVLPVILIIIGIVLIVYGFLLNNQSTNLSNKSNTLDDESTNSNNSAMTDMVTTLCDGDYKTVYENSKVENQGIYECSKDNYVYYVKKVTEQCSYDKMCAQEYEYGYVYHKYVEEIFPKGLYFYRESKVTDIPSEFKIAFEAKTEEELINNNSDKLYQVIKKINNDEIILVVYFNESLSGINTTYDKLFLNAIYTENNVTQSRGFGTEHGDYIFYDGNPEELINNIFGDKTSYPTNARNAIKFNRHILFEIDNVETITKEEFTKKLKTSFKEGI